jgi:hypothetical protein
MKYTKSHKHKVQYYTFQNRFIMFHTNYGSLKVQNLQLREKINLALVNFFYEEYKNQISNFVK